MQVHHGKGRPPCLLQALPACTSVALTPVHRHGMSVVPHLACSHGHPGLSLAPGLCGPPSCPFSRTKLRSQWPGQLRSPSRHPDPGPPPPRSPRSFPSLPGPQVRLQVPPAQRGRQGPGVPRERHCLQPTLRHICHWRCAAAWDVACRACARPVPCNVRTAAQLPSNPAPATCQPRCLLLPATQAATALSTSGMARTRSACTRHVLSPLHCLGLRPQPMQCSMRGVWASAVAPHSNYRPGVSSKLDLPSWKVTRLCFQSPPTPTPQPHPHLNPPALQPFACPAVPDTPQVAGYPTSIAALAFNSAATQLAVAASYTFEQVGLGRVSPISVQASRMHAVPAHWHAMVAQSQVCPASWQGHPSSLLALCDGSCFKSWRLSRHMRPHRRAGRAGAPRGRHPCAGGGRRGGATQAAAARASVTP